MQVTSLVRTPRAVRTAFLINLYNVMIIHGMAIHGAPTTLWQARMCGEKRAPTHGCVYRASGGGLLTGVTVPTFLQRLAFYANVSYRVGQYRLSCNDIEHGILRCNKTGPASMRPCVPSRVSPAGCIAATDAWALCLCFYTSSRFRCHDDRISLALPAPLDARIHFALVRAAMLSPRVVAASRASRVRDATTVRAACARTAAPSPAHQSGCSTPTTLSSS